jgi:hypothetical protein
MPLFPLLIFPQWQVEHVLCLSNERAQTREETNWVEGRDVWWQDAVLPPRLPLAFSPPSALLPLTLGTLEIQNP